jgi:hypothetical protein
MRQKEGNKILKVTSGTSLKEQKPLCFWTLYYKIFKEDL